jgi:hydroxymethylbilane synthase
VKAGLEGESEVRVVHTSGDRFTEQPLGDQNAAGFFTREIEEDLLAGNIDLAVHSLKDLPTTLAPGLAFGALMKRDDPADILLVRPEAHDPGGDLPLKTGAVVGASSRRREALLHLFRPGLSVRPIRGNVPTRVDRVRSGYFDAIILSRAGLERLGLMTDPLFAWELNPLRWPGAPGQAIIAVEVRANDTEALRRAAALNDPSTAARAAAERSLLAIYGGGCHSPFGAYCETGPRGGMMVAAAPGSDGFLIERFAGSDLEQATAAAEAWILSGRPRRGKGGDEWVCRPARPCR